MTKYNDINSAEVEDFLNSWKDGVIDIGIAYQEGIDYRENARTFIETHYAFDTGDVLFKPTLSNDVVFRNNLEDALSYFVTGDISTQEIKLGKNLLQTKYNTKMSIHKS